MRSALAAIAFVGLLARPASPQTRTSAAAASAVRPLPAAIASVPSAPSLAAPALPSLLQAPIVLGPAAPVRQAPAVPASRAAVMAGAPPKNSRPEGEKAVPSALPSERAQKMGDEMRKFVEAFHKELMQERPDLFELKMKKAAASEFAFYRAFPQLFYAQLKRAPEAPVLAQTRKILLAGDLHAENSELVSFRSKSVLQPNDFDDAAIAPVALEIARLLGSAGALTDKPKDRAALIQEASRAYAKSTGEKFSDWVDGLKEEKSVRDAKQEDREWAKRVGPPLSDAELARRLLKAAGLDAEVWTVHDRMGSGLSSIGMRRYLFISKEHDHVFELKELRGSALLYFTQEAEPDSQRPRIDAAFKDLREVPAEARTLSFDGKEWVLRRREAKQAGLNLDRAKSAARVLAGLGAQLHRQGATMGELDNALKAVPTELVERSLQFMSGMRDALRKLLRDGAWGSPVH